MTPSTGSRKSAKRSIPFFDYSLLSHADALTKIKGGLRAVYRTLELPGKNPLKDAHANLDAAVCQAYNFNPKSDLLAQLLALNQQVADKEKANEKVTPPGVPPDYGDPSSLITQDCIKP
jgi:hypothetical protein